MINDQTEFMSLFPKSAQRLLLKRAAKSIGNMVSDDGKTSTDNGKTSTESDQNMRFQVKCLIFSEISILDKFRF